MGHGVQGGGHLALKACCLVASIKEERNTAHELGFICNLLIDSCVSASGFFPGKTVFDNELAAGLAHSRAEGRVIA